LDFTAVTDAGLQQLIGNNNNNNNNGCIAHRSYHPIPGLSKLETLSLSRTRTTNETLCLFGDFEVTGFTKSLRTLNLSQCTHVSDKGVKGLSGKKIK
jgi:hypothetical protein